MQGQRQDPTPNGRPYATKTVSVVVDIYKDGTRVLTLPSGFTNYNIRIIERSDEYLNVSYTKKHLKGAKK